MLLTCPVDSSVYEFLTEYNRPSIYRVFRLLFYLATIFYNIVLLLKLCLYLGILLHQACDEI